MKKKLLILLALSLLLASLLAPAVAALSIAYPEGVYDDGHLLTDQEKENLRRVTGHVSSQTNCLFFVATHRIASVFGDEKWGEDFLYEKGFSQGQDIVLLIVTMDSRGDYYYDFYTYGDATDAITDREVDYILDHESVYDNIKSGNLEEGIASCMSLALQARIGVIEGTGIPWGTVTVVSLVIACVIAAVSCFGVYKAYTAKKKSVDYPLEHFAKLELVHSNDIFKGSFVTKRVIQSSSSGGGGGRGGGSGHRGGR